ncbi:activating transcription factor 7a [Cordyceps militaris CM01]|uniref:Activating transcription factor 7a n=1 Tax=Cordyceps militaris (strain CM01) TaxID=983644 RepID=G3JU84_CORMM|nr:activating transcription factor 7a [Cordyceps militaris CM01]EGX87791.1 activating transcription factor 7a [Cordyceps militaris CM01]
MRGAQASFPSPGYMQGSQGNDGQQRKQELHRHTSAAFESQRIHGASNPGLSAMLAGTNLSIDPVALLHQHNQEQPLFEKDTSSSRTTSTSSVPRLSTPDTENDDDKSEKEDDDTPQNPKTRSKTKMPAASTRSKTNAAPTKSKRGGAATGTADKRRKRNLERNRAAASKCRQRKKQWQDGLERKKMELESRYKSLHAEVKDLMEEVAQLKNFVMAHGACNDANIDDWIRNEADSFVRRMSAAQMQQNAAAHSATLSAASMSQMQSPLQGSLTATPPMNDSLNNMFAPAGSESPFDKIHSNDLRPGGAGDAVDQNNNIFNQDLLMMSSIQT